jgi:hypothetical protein
MNHKERSEYGIKFEDLFIEDMNKANIYWIKSNRSHNICDHIDFFIGDNLVPIDIKSGGWKDFVWLEYTNVRGNKGWLRGKSKYIVWKKEDTYYFFNRESLRDYVCYNIKERTTNKNDFYNIYTRYGRKDEIVKVEWKFLIDNFIHKKLKINEERKS